MSASPPLPTGGRWMRRGREIVLLPGEPGGSAELAGETGPIPATTQGSSMPPSTCR
ncbi:MAG TPA: hypothetical protein VHG08_02365 [Longimicrobium sp.]|nr:hypothetical protein [Longimicrobium sp.]